MDKKARRGATDGARWWRRIDRRGGADERGKGAGVPWRAPPAVTPTSICERGGRGEDRAGVGRQRDARGRSRQCRARVAAARSGFRGDARAIAAGHVGQQGRAPPRAFSFITTRRPPSSSKACIMSPIVSLARVRRRSVGMPARASWVEQRVLAPARGRGRLGAALLPSGVRTDLSRTFLRESVFACFRPKLCVMPLARLQPPAHRTRASFSHDLPPPSP